jgi:hypothetical protein
MKSAILLALLVLASGPARAADPLRDALPPAFLEAEPGFAAIGALPEALDLPALERAALLASGVEEAALAPYISKLERLFDVLGREAGAIADPRARAEAALGFLHRNALRAYRGEATTLDGILDTGRFNCVSSAVLYLLAARSLGLEAGGVRTSDHAFATVLVGGRSVDVETTNPFGFDPGGKKEFKDSFGTVTGFAYVAPGGYGDRRPISARNLVGLILSNRASLLEQSLRFAEAVRLGADYAALCPGQESRGFFGDRINNLVASLESRRDYPGAEEVARAGAAALPSDPRLAALAASVSYNRAAALAQSGDWAAAFDAAVAAASPGNRAAERLVSDCLSGLAQALAQGGDYARARAAVAERAARAGPAAAAGASRLVGEVELVHAANSLPFPAAAAAAERILAAGEVEPARWTQALEAIYGNEAGRIGAGGDWLAGAALAERGAAIEARSAPGAAGGGSRLLGLAASLRHNFVAEAHNLFARRYNSGDYRGAKAAIEAALAAGGAALAKDPTLSGDLADAQAAAGR